MPSRVVECRGVESTASQSVSSSSSTSRLCPCSRWAQLVACRPQPAPPPAASRLALINDCKVQNVTSPTEVGRKTRHLGSKHDHTLVATVLIRKIATRRVYASRGYSSGPLHSSDKSLSKNLITIHKRAHSRTHTVRQNTTMPPCPCHVTFPTSLIARARLARRGRHLRDLQRSPELRLWRRCARSSSCSRAPIAALRENLLELSKA